MIKDYKYAVRSEFGTYGFMSYDIALSAFERNGTVLFEIEENGNMKILKQKTI